MKPVPSLDAVKGRKEGREEANLGKESDGWGNQQIDLIFSILGLISFNPPRFLTRLGMLHTMRPEDYNDVLVTLT